MAPAILNIYTPQLAARSAGVLVSEICYNNEYMETILLIDGENFKGKIRSVFKDVKKDKPVWHEYDFKGLLDKVLKDISLDKKVFYFARIKEHEDSKEKSKQLIEEQRQLKTHLEKQGFEVVLSGRVRGQLEEGQGGKKILIFKEKGVDVKIAVDMVSLACDKKIKEIILRIIQWS